MTEATTTKPTKIEALRSKIAAKQADLSKLEAALAAEVLAEETTAAQAQARATIEVTGLPPLSRVRFQYGRKDTRKELTGEVVAFRPAQDTLPAAYRIEVGSGFDTEVLTVPARDVEVITSSADA